jgi:ADP-ribosylglycohydrolase
VIGVAAQSRAARTLGADRRSWMEKTGSHFLAGIDPVRAAPLLGLAVADALCAPREFSACVAPKFPQLARGPITEMVGGGPFGLVPGQVTDDSMMATCLASSLRTLGRYDVDDVAARYLVWMRETFDAGVQTRAALSLIRAGTSPRHSGRAVWLRSGKTSAGNGALMRCAPLGVFFADNSEARRHAVIADAEMTHCDPKCVLACAAFTAAISATITTEKVSADMMWSAAREELDFTARILMDARPEDAAQTEMARLGLTLDLVLARRDDPQLFSEEVHLTRTQGFVRVAFRLGFWELLHAPTLEAALIDIAARGGDTDTNGAIAGALLGALHGFEALPDRWVRAVMRALQDGPPGPFRDAYHPRVLVQLAEVHR